MPFRQVLNVTVFMALAAGNVLAQGSQQTPDAIFYGGKVVTVDSTFSIQQAFAVKGDQFVQVGSDTQIRALAGPNTRQIYLRGRTVVPGFADNHDHVYAIAMLHRGVDVSGVTSLSDMLSRIRQALPTVKPGKAVFTTGGWVTSLKEAPTQQDLDQISSDVPVVVVRGGQGQAPILNTAAIKATGGAHSVKAIAQLIPPPTEEEQEKLILAAQKGRNAEGLTSVRDLTIGPEAMRAYDRLWLNGRLTLRTSMGLRIDDNENMEDILKTWGVSSRFGDYWLRLDSVSENPLPEPPGDRFVQAMLLENRFNWRPAPHICDRGCGSDNDQETLDIALNAYEAADRESSIREKRWVVEHVPTVRPNQMERLARLGVLVSAQFQPYYLDFDWLVRRVGGNQELAEREVPMRELLYHHLSVSSGSDFHGTTDAGKTDNPLVSFYFYVTRKTRQGRVLGPQERISREEALRVATINEAYLTFEEKVKGSIEAGKLADFVILSQDILTVPDDQILATHPLATYVGGHEVFSDRDSGF
jgi:predicted amidohydrolase YtcJ